MRLIEPIEPLIEYAEQLPKKAVFERKSRIRF
jgi:hypothetical protein